MKLLPCPHHTSPTELPDRVQDLYLDLSPELRPNQKISSTRVDDLPDDFPNYKGRVTENASDA